MAPSFSFDAHFEMEGRFIDPPSNSEVLGRLVYDADGLTLKRSAYIVDTAQLFPTTIERFGTLLGVTTADDCALFDVFLAKPGAQLFLSDGRRLTTGNYHIGSCVIGAHISSKDEPVITSASFSYAGLEDWLGNGITANVDVANSIYSISHPLRAEPIVKREIPALEAEVSMWYVFGSRSNRTESAVFGQPIVSVTPHQPKSLTWFLEIANRLENFFSLVLGVSTALTRMEVRLDDRHTGKFLEHRLSKAQATNPYQWVRCTIDQLYDALERWFSLPDRVRLIENLIYGTIRNSSLFVETEFLSLAQALESFHRVTDDTLLLPAEEFKEVKRVLAGLIGFFFVSEPDIKTRLIESISYANELAFRQRIDGLITRLTPEHATELLGNKNTFVTKLKDTRNFFTHPGIASKKTMLLNAIELFNFNRQLHALLRLLVLLYVGFPEDVVFGCVRNQVVKVEPL